MDDFDFVPLPRRDGVFREINWRWGRAECFARHELTPRRDDDPDTRAAWRYLVEREDEDRPRSRRRRDDVRVAIDAARALAGRDDPARWEAEARILAGQDDDAIGARCGLEPQVIRWFESLLFCVRDRLSATDWIMTHAIGPVPWVGYRTVGDLWKSVAYSGGPDALDVMIAATADLAGASGSKSPGVRQTFPDELIEGARLLALALLMPAATSTAHWAKLLEQGGRVESMRRPSAVADAIARESARLAEATRPIPAVNPNRKSRRAGVA